MAITSTDKDGREFVGSAEVVGKRKAEASLRGGRRRVRVTRLKESDIEERIKIAKTRNASRNKGMDDIDDIWKRVFKNLKKDVAETDTPMIKTPRGEAILDVFYSLLTVGAAMETQVLPLKSGLKEQQLCTKLERVLDGIQFEIESTSNKVPYQDGIHWFLRKGLGVWKPLFLPRSGGDCPLSVDALDPYHVYPVEEDKLLWVVEERWKYAGEFKRHLQAMRGASPKGSRLKWRVPKFEGKADTDKIKVTAYQDEHWEALLAEDEWVYIRPNHLGFIRYAIGKCRRTPDDDPAWASQGILAPMLGLLALETEILTKFGTSISLFFYDRLVAQTEDNRTIILEGAPGEIDGIPFGAKLTQLRQGSNMDEALNLLGQAQSLANIIGLPTVMFGEPPGQVQAGYPMSLLMNAAKTRLRREAGQIEWGLARSQEMLLRMIARYGGLNGGIPIYVGVDEGAGRRKALMTVSDEDVEGHFRAKVTVSPKLPQDWIQYAAVAAKLRQENKAGEPLLSDDTIRELILEIKEPVEEKERIFEQFMMRNPDVLAHKMEKWLEDWRKRERIKTPEELAERARKLIPPPSQMRQMMGPGMGQMPTDMGQGMGVPPQVMPPAMAGMPPQAPAMPGQEGPEALLRQTMPPRGY